jgi:hypothetical protein
MTPQFVSAQAKEFASQLQMLRSEFLATAEWRRQKAADYPDDKRNLEAATSLGTPRRKGAPPAWRSRGSVAGWSGALGAEGGRS